MRQVSPGGSLSGGANVFEGPCGSAMTRFRSTNSGRLGQSETPESTEHLIARMRARKEKVSTRA